MLKGFMHASHLIACQGLVVKNRRSHFKRVSRTQRDSKSKTENSEKQYQSPSCFCLIHQINRDRKRENNEEFGEMKSKLQVRFVLEPK